MPSNHLILCLPLLLLPSLFPGIRVFSNESALRIEWPKYWSFSISPSNEHSGLVSFTLDWFDLLAVQGTLKSLLPVPNPKASVLQCSAFFVVQLLHPYMATRKTIAFIIWAFVGKVMSLLFKMLSRFVIAFLARSKCLSNFMTTGETIALTIWTLVDKVMSLLFNMLSRFVIAFLPRSNCLYFMAVVART